VVWGEPGTNGQHAYFQMLHQGTDVIPVEFILVKRPTHALADLHTKLLANGLAQSQALMLGKSSEQASSERAPTASKALDPATLARHRTFPGNRPSTTLLLDQLTPRSKAEPRSARARAVPRPAAPGSRSAAPASRRRVRRRRCAARRR